jgi:16S rRNA (cytosine(1402)-N(4))-methyltransferase
MSKVFKHLSVMAEVAPEQLVFDPDGTYVDGTFGRGGHSRLILSKLSPNGRLIAFDRDPEAIEASREITDPRFEIIHAPFSQMAECLQARGVSSVDGIFLDIGVSSPQIDDASRGFSFRMDGPLDMRMDTTRGQTAAQWLATETERNIARVIADLAKSVLRAKLPEPSLRLAKKHRSKPLKRWFVWCLLSCLSIRKIRRKIPLRVPSKASVSISTVNWMSCKRLLMRLWTYCEMVVVWPLSRSTR